MAAISNGRFLYTSSADDASGAVWGDVVHDAAASHAPDRASNKFFFRIGYILFFFMGLIIISRPKSIHDIASPASGLRLGNRFFRPTQPRKVFFNKIAKRS